MWRSSKVSKKLEKACPNCGEEIIGEDSLCPYCGALIEEPSYDIESDLRDEEE